MLAEGKGKSKDHHDRVEEMMAPTATIDSAVVIAKDKRQHPNKTSYAAGADQDTPPPKYTQESGTPQMPSPPPAQASGTAPTSPGPELDPEIKQRMELNARLVALQERKAELEIKEREAELQRAAQEGHKYGNTTATGNARIIKGNVFSGGSSQQARAYAKRHLYGTTNASEKAGVVEGDMEIEQLMLLINGGAVPDVQGSRR